MSDEPDAFEELARELAEAVRHGPFGEHDVVPRPLQHDEISSEQMEHYDDLERLECVECGTVSQGHTQAMELMFQSVPCEPDDNHQEDGA